MSTTTHTLGSPRPSSRGAGAALAWAAVPTWTVIAFIYREPLYDWLAVLASSVTLAAAIAFYRWRAPAHLADFRLVAFFVSSHTFVSSGVATLLEVEGVRFQATVESFSFAVHASVVFGAVTLLAIRLTAPSPGRWTPPVVRGEPGPTRGVALVLALATAALGVGYTMTGSARFGTVPMIFLSMSLLVPMFGAQRLLSPRRPTLPLAILLGAQALATLYSSSIGVVLLSIRDLAFAHVVLRKRLPWALLATGAVAAVVLNPAKHIFRQTSLERGEAERDVTFLMAFDWWGRSLERTWGTRATSRSPAAEAVESTVRRMGYNDMMAHVHATVPSRLPYEMGATYEDIPMIVIPRFIYPDKPSSASYTRGRWLVKLGVQDPVSIMRTAVAVPAPAEAYWNFGWPGILAIGSLLGFAVGLMLRILPRDPVARAAYVVLVATTLALPLDMLVWTAPAFVTAAISMPLAELYCRINKFRKSHTAAQAPHTKTAGESPV